jgi:hypothetical protein
LHFLRAAARCPVGTLTVMIVGVGGVVVVGGSDVQLKYNPAIWLSKLSV